MNDSVQAAQQQRQWHIVDVLVEPVAREAVEYALMEAGALGTEVKETGTDLLRVCAYFSGVPNSGRVQAELLEGLRIYSLQPSSIRELKTRDIADQDWLHEWKKTWRPIAVGKRFIIAPPWTDVSEPGERFVIRIEPGMAFGTGTHETTQLCVAAIEK